MLGLAVQAVPASAAIQYTLNCDGSATNCSGANANFNFGTVTLSDNGGGSVNVSVVLASGYQFNPNNSQSLYWNSTIAAAALNSGETISNLTGGFGSNGLQANGSFTAGNAGTYLISGGTNFDFRVQRSNNSGSPTALSFDVTRVGGLTIGNFAEGNNDGLGVYYFAAQIRTGSTTFWVASNKAGVDIPEPATWLLFFSVLAGLTLLYHRRKLAHA